MDHSEVLDKLTLLSADTDSIQVLSTEVSEIVEPNSSDYFKLHAIYSIAEKMDNVINSMICDIERHYEQQ